MLTNSFFVFYLLLSLVQALLEICLETTKTLIRHCIEIKIPTTLQHSACLPTMLQLLR